MTVFQRFDNWVKSIGDKTIKPVAQVAVYGTSALLGIPMAGKYINDVWQSNETATSNTITGNVPENTVQPLTTIPPAFIWFVGFLILIFFVSTSNKRKK
jgi:hypothetical protein